MRTTTNSFFLGISSQSFKYVGDICLLVVAVMWLGTSAWDEFKGEEGDNEGDAVEMADKKKGDEAEAEKEKMSAELELKASQADVSAAKSAFFPSISLFGMAGFNAFEFSRLFFQPASTAYQLGAGLTAPIFNRREIQKEYMYAKADQKIAFLEYEKKTLNAYLEVLDLVNQIKTYENQMKLSSLL